MIPSTSRTIFSIVCGFQFAAMAFLVIACVTAPVFKQIGLSKFDDTTYGVFGYCQTDNGCSKPAALYGPDKIGQGNSDNWKMGEGPRRILGKILIITPVAAGLNFISFISTIVSFIVVLASGSTSAVLFTINLTLTVIGFLSSALMCIVVFLLFFPNVTWCSWLLIPAAALQLIVIPLIFVAHSSRAVDEDEEDDELKGVVQHDAVDEVQFESPSKITGFYKNTSRGDTSTSLSEKPLIVPSYGYGNYYKPESVVKISSSTTDQSTSSKEHLVENEYDIDADKNSHTAFSAINGDDTNGQKKKTVYSAALSLASSEYSNQNYSHDQYEKEPRGVLEDIIKDSLTKDDLIADGHIRSASDNESDFTSISQRAARQQVPQQMSGPKMVNTTTPQGRMPYNTRSAGPDPSEILLQNNPNFLQPNSRRMQPQPAVNYQQPQYSQNYYPPRQPNAYGGFQNVHNMPLAQPANTGSLTSTHYKPAYKKRVNARNNMIPPASAINGRNPYQFR